MFWNRDKVQMITADKALKGRDQKMAVSPIHHVLKTPMEPPFPANYQLAMFGMGCFWGAERKFWEIEGVYSTAVGYAGGHTPNPTYQEVCAELTGHAEVVHVVFDPEITSYQQMLKTFWENHNPTQGMRQGNDMGTQYRSAVYWHNSTQQHLSQNSLHSFQAQLLEAGFGEITTECYEAPTFYYAEDYHQQYLAKNPTGYCGLGGTGLSWSSGITASE